MRTRLLLLFLFISLSFYGQNDLRFLSWNIQNLGSNTKEKEIEQIANIICEYDLVAIQGIQANKKVGEKIILQLIEKLNAKGSHWSYALSVATQAKKSLRIQYAYLWKSKQISLIEKQLLTEQKHKILHEPYVLQILWNNQVVTIYNYQAKNYKKHPEKEIKALSKFISNQESTYILMGSFNLTQKNEVFQGFRENNSFPVITEEKTLLKNRTYYKDYLHLSIDNIYYKATDIELLSSGVLDYVGSSENLTIAYRISSHLPVVAHFKLRKAYENMVQHD